MRNKKANRQVEYSCTNDIKLVRQSQMLQCVGSSTVVTQVLTSARFILSLYLSWYLGLFPLQNNFDQTDNLSSVYDSCLYFHSMLNNNLYILLFVKTAFKFYSGVLHWFSFISNSIISWSSRHDNFTFHANVCNLILLFSSQRHVIWNPCFLQNIRKMSLFFGDKWKKVKYLTKKWKRNDFVFSQNANFFITDEQELIQLSDSHGIPLSFPVATFVVTIKQFKINTQQYTLIPLGSISMRSIEGKQRYLADVIMRRWTSLLKDWLN